MDLTSLYSIAATWLSNFEQHHIPLAAFIVASIGVLIRFADHLIKREQLRLQKQAASEGAPE